MKPYFSVPFILKSDIFICCHTWRDMASNSTSGAPSCQNIYRTNCSLSSSSSAQLNEINFTFHSKIFILQNHSVKPNKFLHCKLTDLYFFRMSDGFYSTDWDNQDGSQGYTNQAFDQNAYSANAYDNSYDQSQSYNPNMYNGDMYTPGE